MPHIVAAIAFISLGFILGFILGLYESFLQVGHHINTRVCEGVETLFEAAGAGSSGDGGGSGADGGAVGEDGVADVGWQA